MGYDFVFGSSNSIKFGISLSLIGCDDMVPLFRENSLKV